MEKILFSADLHGNLSQYQAILTHAQDHHFDIVIFGGDLTPKDPERRTPAKQRAFIEDQLFLLLDQNKEHPNAPHVLFIMGNDDFRSNYSIMVNGQDFHGYRMIDQIPYILKQGYAIIGYSYVPYTPFQYKCWERRDRKTDADFRYRPDTRQNGVMSAGNDLVPYSLNPNEVDSIETDLDALTQNLDPRKLILVSHTPPFDTVCDVIRENKHVGSRAVRHFIENTQPLLTLHGHIHETVDLSGQFKEMIGETLCIAAGNDHKPKEPYAVEIGMDKTIKLNRLRLGIYTESLR